MPCDNKGREIRVRQLPAEECQGLMATPETGGGKEGFYPEYLSDRDPAPMLILNLQFPEPQEDNFLLFY